jgi:hypothetical protein
MYMKTNALQALWWTILSRSLHRVETDLYGQHFNPKPIRGFSYRSVLKSRLLLHVCVIIYPKQALALPFLTRGAALPVPVLVFLAVRSLQLRVEVAQTEHPTAVSL